MIAGGFHPRQLFRIDAAGIFLKMKKGTSLNHFKISVVYLYIIILKSKYLTD